MIYILYFGSDAAGEKHEFKTWRELVNKLEVLFVMYDEELDQDLKFEITFRRNNK